MGRKPREKEAFLMLTSEAPQLLFGQFFFFFKGGRKLHNVIKYEDILKGCSV
jgi:hypothetical protein